MPTLPKEHERITVGYWYLRTQYRPYFTIVSVLEEQIDPSRLGEKIVFSIDEEGCHELDVYDLEDFIAPVVNPPILNDDGLAACPFCGGEASVHWNMSTGTDFEVVCNDHCLSSSWKYPTEAQAKAAWNRRT